MADRPDEPLVAPAFEAVAKVARSQLTRAGGGALCIYLHGRPVVDLWSGSKNSNTGEPWEHDTMAMCWSTTKGVASAALHMLADRGKLDYDHRVADYWPEYGTNGKQQTTIGQMMAMEAGLYDIRHRLDDPRQMLDHTAMAELLAAAVPAHRPGARNGYHAMTYGWLVGELVRRISGQSLGSFVATEIAAPLNLDGCYIGVGDQQLPRIAALPELRDEVPAARFVAKAIDPMTSLFGVSLKRMAGAFIPRDANDVMRTSDFLRAEVPSVNGVFTARSLARFYAALGSDDGVDGIRLWSPETRRLATTRRNTRRDLVVPIRVGWQLGFHRPFPTRKSAAGSFGFYGSYGSGAFADPSRNLAVGLVCREAKGLPLTKLLGPILAAADR